MKSPVFLFSMPRSGSTLLQRILMGHPQIASAAEPWLLLPLVYARKNEGMLSEYSHAIGQKALNEFVAQLPGGEVAYSEELAAFANALYTKQCTRGETYFLDKTPRYYLIIPEIAKLFPDAKFIFLFRNPVHVFGSIVQTWCNGRLKKLYAFDRDLHVGPLALSQGYELLRERSVAVQYEALVSDAPAQIRIICDYLEIDYDTRMMEAIDERQFEGTMGDPTGVQQYKRVSSGSLDKWKKVFDTKVRRGLLESYIHRMPESTLEIQGYDKMHILEEIAALPVRGRRMQDRMDLLYSWMVRTAKPNIWFSGVTATWARSKYLS